MAAGSESESPFAYLDISDDDIIEAMQEVPGYLDITSADFRVLYRVAVEHAARRICATKRVREVMRTEVAAIAPDAPLLRLGETMAVEDVSFVAVVDGERRLLGVVTARDLLVGLRMEPERDIVDSVLDYCREGRRCFARRLAARKVRDVMKAPVTVAAEDAVGTLKARQKETGHARYPVVDAEGRLHGVVAVHDLMKACCL